MIASVVYLTVCIGATMSQTNAQVDAIRELNPRATVVVSAIECRFTPDPPTDEDDAAIMAVLERHKRN